MSDKTIQALLEKAGGDYNQGRYAEAIATWQEILKLDPENQKAREGIRMAKLLVVNWETSRGGGDEPSLEEVGVDPETRQKIEFGIKRIRELLAAGRQQEAMEGSQLLAELAPGMASVAQLQEEIAHQIEAQPIVEERLGRARKLLAADKVAEALAEAKKVLSVDPNNEEARVLVLHAEGDTSGLEGPPPSAFQSGSEAAPPSPFAGSASADQMAASMGFEEDDGAVDAGQEMPLEMGFEEADEPAAASDPGGGEVGELIREGRRLFGHKKYRDAIDTWSRVYAIDESNTEVGDLIDQARARMEEIGVQVEQAMYRAQDQIQAGNFAGARKAFEEVLAIQPGNPEALSEIAKIDEQIHSVEEIGDAIPMADMADMDEAAAPAPPQPAKAGAHEAPSVALAGRPGGAGARSDATQPVNAPASPDLRDIPSAPMSAGLPRRRPVVASPPARTGSNRVILGALGLVVLLAVAGGWWFLMGPGAEPPPPLDPEPQASGGPLPGSGNPANAATGSPGGEVTPEGEAEDGGGRAAPAPPPPPTDPAEIKRKVAALMAQGRAALGSHEYAKAQASFVEVLRIEPTNFDAEELRIKAAAGVVEEKRFNRDLESAKQAFKDQDWGSSLYRLYRLQQERPEMKALSLYIRNANHNWGVQSMEAFQIADALEHFRDALEQEPGDKAIQQHMDVAGRYEQRRRNTAYDAYVAKLRLRALDAP